MDNYSRIFNFSNFFYRDSNPIQCCLWSKIIQDTRIIIMNGESLYNHLVYSLISINVLLIRYFYLFWYFLTNCLKCRKIYYLSLSKSIIKWILGYLSFFFIWIKYLFISCLFVMLFLFCSYFLALFICGEMGVWSYWSCYL